MSGTVALRLRNNSKEAAGCAAVSARGLQVVTAATSKRALQKVTAATRRNSSGGELRECTWSSSGGGELQVELQRVDTVN